MTLQRREPLGRRKALPLAVHPLRRRSEARDAYEAELDAMRPLVLERSGGRCEFAALYEDGSQIAACPLPATEVHHRKMRSAGGRNELANLVAACRDHHQIAHADPGYAYEHGWLVHPWQDPAEVPVNVRRETA